LWCLKKGAVVRDVIKVINWISHWHFIGRLYWPLCSKNKKRKGGLLKIADIPGLNDQKRYFWIWWIWKMQ
jgi:hypothetical protein